LASRENGSGRLSELIFAGRERPAKQKIFCAFVQIPFSVYLCLFLSFSVSSGCIGGNSYDTNGNRKANVAVYAQTCPACDPIGPQYTDLGLPSWDFDPYLGEPFVPPTNGEEATRFLFIADTANYEVYHRPQWEVDPNTQHWYSQVVDTVFPTNIGPDSDGDGLPDEVENRYGTDPYKADTDGDGVGDYGEIYGWDWVDYPSFGANPLRADAFVEVDYLEYTDAGGTVHSWRMSDAVVQKIETLFNGLSNTNPDGSTGISVHIFQNPDLTDPATPCYDRSVWLPTQAPFNPRHVAGFRYAAICQDTLWHGGATLSPVTGPRFYVAGPGFNNITVDDQIEEAQFWLYSRFAHELGHTLSLKHGGFEPENYKPNYPSLMNYHYDYDLNGSPHTLLGTQIQFSPGTWPDIDEVNGVQEAYWAPWNTTPTFLTSYDGGPFNVILRHVDWNRDGAYTGTVTGVLRIPTSDTHTPMLLKDNNDAQRMADEMDTMISGVANAGEDYLTSTVETNLIAEKNIAEFDKRVRSLIKTIDARRSKTKETIEAEQIARRKEKARDFEARTGFPLYDDEINREVHY
jgi:hypothetical protein